MSFLNAAVLLFLVIDPVGNVPLFVSVLTTVEHSRRRKIVFREMIIALAVLVLFLFTGRYLLVFLGISEVSLSISGGIILFLIAVRMIFNDARNIFGFSAEGEPFIFPLAVPFIAGPSTMATVLLLMAREPDRWHVWLTALFCAWLVSCVILFLSDLIAKRAGPRTLAAVDRLMGMLLTTIAVEIFLKGIRML